MKNGKFSISRRGILKTLPAGAAFAVSGCAKIEEKKESVPIKFKHNVASGDPLQDRVVIWTRTEPVDAMFIGDVDGEWEVSSSQEFNKIAKKGTFSTNADQDFTVKVDVTGLEAGQNYFYRFKVGNEISPVGETKTLDKSGVRPIKIAVASCSNYPWGYFNGYRAIAENGPFDAVIHLGDYIYEYPVGTYQSPNAEKMGRLVDPPHEILTISDYRRRYAQYRSDADLQEVHRKYPFICTWDDHEFANNSYATGAENHNDGEGDWAERRRAATKAYMEWIPVRVASDDLPTVRSFDFGELATLAMLDTRIVGRERPLEYGRDVEMITVDDVEMPDYAAFHKRLETEERSLIGEKQEVWLDQTLAKSAAKKIPWQIIGQQIIMSFRPEPPLSSVFSPEEMKELPEGEQLSMKVAEEFGGFYNPDAWDGYQPARRRVYDLFKKHASNPIVLTGDTHCGWAMSLTDKMGGEHYGAEFAVPGITSPGRGERIPKVEQVEQAYYDFLDHLAYANIKQRGYLTVTISQEEAIADWYVLSDIESKQFDLIRKKSLKYKWGDVSDGKVVLEDITT
ncbi:MAG: alkaline phosphatase D family protein [Alphaproteobacteria bacterium]|nr:alkaline phosphatase D family protein [Alphaproteobacteria bacterium]HPF45714.1 alkaline phosphatase D family protein [Emcibacteraceae bacterium]HRW29873.1 alkaline phosphatase D family protein [Emcibacteraceae bacterium]